MGLIKKFPEQAYFEEIPATREDYLSGRILPEEFRRTLSEGDFREHLGEISFVYGLNEANRTRIAISFQPFGKMEGDYPLDYLEELDKWLEVEELFLGERLGRLPLRSELFIDSRKSQTFHRHHLQYLLAHPERMHFVHNWVETHGNMPMDFLTRAKELSGVDYPLLVRKW
ncbi:MAG: hypothetical protein AABX11_03185 [Nanoarchaeota archaeon]